MKKSENPFLRLFDRNGDSLFHVPLPGIRDYWKTVRRAMITVGIIELVAFLSELGSAINNLFAMNYDTGFRELQAGRFVLVFWNMVFKMDTLLLVMLATYFLMNSFIPLITMMMHRSEGSIYTIMRLPENHKKCPKLRLMLAKRLLFPPVVFNLAMAAAQGLLFAIMAAAYYLLVPDAAIITGQRSLFIMLRPDVILFVIGICVGLPAVLLTFFMFFSKNRRVLWSLPVLAAATGLGFVIWFELAMWVVYRGEGNLYRVALVTLATAVIAVVCNVMYLSKGME